MTCFGKFEGTTKIERQKYILRELKKAISNLESGQIYITTTYDVFAWQLKKKCHKYGLELLAKPKSKHYWFLPKICMHISIRIIYRGIKDKPPIPKGRYLIIFKKINSQEVT